mgnify:CR=1 FL=1
MNKRQKKKLIQAGDRQKPAEKNEIFREKLSPGNKQAVGRKENDSKLLLGQREVERNCSTIYESMGRYQGNNRKGSGCTDKAVFRYRNKYFRSSGKLIRGKYEKCGKYNKKLTAHRRKRGEWN